VASVIQVNLLEGDDESRTFQITSGGSAMNISAVTVTALIKASVSVEDDAVGVTNLTVGDGLTIMDAAAGKVRMAFPDDVVASPSTWYYKIKLTVSGDTRTAIHGWIAVQDT
jgi:hypothetical protein